MDSLGFKMPTDDEIEECFCHLIDYVSWNWESVDYEAGTAELKEFVRRAIESALVEYKQSQIDKR